MFSCQSVLIGAGPKPISDLPPQFSQATGRPSITSLLNPASSMYLHQPESPQSRLVSLRNSLTAPYPACCALCCFASCISSHGILQFATNWPSARYPTAFSSISVYTLMGVACFHVPISRPLTLVCGLEVCIPACTPPHPLLGTSLASSDTILGHCLHRLAQMSCIPSMASCSTVAEQTRNWSLPRRYSLMPVRR